MGIVLGTKIIQTQKATGPVSPGWGRESHEVLERSYQINNVWPKCALTRGNSEEPQYLMCCHEKLNSALIAF